MCWPALHVGFGPLCAHALAQHLIELTVLKRAAVVIVERVEDGVRIFSTYLKAERPHCLVKLLLVDGATLILVPRAKQINYT